MTLFPSAVIDYGGLSSQFRPAGCLEAAADPINLRELERIY